MIGDRVREIEWGAVVVCGVEMIEGETRQKCVVRESVHPGEVHSSSVPFGFRPGLSVHCDHAVSGAYARLLISLVSDPESDRNLGAGKPPAATDLSDLH